MQNQNGHNKCFNWHLLTNADHRIVGQLHGGYSACDDDPGAGTGPLAPDYYGIFGKSWDDGTFGSFLDPSGLNVQTVDTYCPSLDASPPVDTLADTPTCNTPNEYFKINDETGPTLILCPEEHPVLEVGCDASLEDQTLIATEDVKVKCKDSDDCTPLQQLLNNCDCTKRRYKYYVEIQYDCDGSYTCANAIGKWYTRPLADGAHWFFDAATEFGFTFEEGKHYRIKLAGVYIDVSSITGKLWKEGIKNIYVANYDLDIIDQLIVDPVYVAASHITVLRSQQYSPVNSKIVAGVEIKMLDGTVIQSGSKLRAYIDPTLPCYDGHRYASGSPDDSEEDSLIEKTYSIVYYDSPKKESNESISKPAKEKEKEKSIETSFFISPNPTDDEITLQFKSSEEKLTQINIYKLINFSERDKMVKSINISNKANLDDSYLKIPIPEIESGTYLIELITDKKKYFDKLIVN